MEFAVILFDKVVLTGLKQYHNYVGLSEDFNKTEDNAFYKRNYTCV